VIRLSLRVSAGLTILFALLIAMLHAIPYDNSDLRPFFLPGQGCAAPCFMGIRPQTTTHAQASALLLAQSWVDTVTDTPGTLFWSWNGKQPAFVSSRASDFEVGQIDFANGIVARITLSTATDWADFFAVFGAPDREFFTAGASPSEFYPFLAHVGDYAAYGFEVVTNTPCPIKSRADLWYSPVSIVLPGQPLNGLIPISRGC